VKIVGIIWLEEIVQKLIWKHSVEQFEVVELLENSPRLRFVEKGHRIGENVYSALGQTYSGRYLTVFFVHKADNQALILSARDMTDAERKRYGKK
jgi:uncharacterized protein